MSENPTTYNEAITEETRQMLALYQLKVLGIFDEILHPKPAIKLVVETDGVFQLLQELRNYRTDLDMSGDTYYAKLIELAIIEMGFTVTGKGF